MKLHMTAEKASAEAGAIQNRGLQKQIRTLKLHIAAQKLPLGPGLYKIGAYRSKATVHAIMSCIRRSSRKAYARAISGACSTINSKRWAHHSSSESAKVIDDEESFAKTAGQPAPNP